MHISPKFSETTVRHKETRAIYLVCMTLNSIVIAARKALIDAFKHLISV